MLEPPSLSLPAPWILGVLALPHVYYAVLWLSPQTWLGVAGALSPCTRSRVELGNAACRHMASTAHLLKAVQVAGLWLWVRQSFRAALSLDFLRSQDPRLLVAALALLAVGQLFNVAIYRAIGRNGVYYGNRFGAQIGPWHTGFPFNAPWPCGRHPQYFGVLCTVWGLTLLLWCAALLEAGLLMLAIVWSAYYLVTGVIEEMEDTDRQKKH